MKTNHDSCTNGRHMTRNQSLAYTFWTITPNRLLGELRLDFILVLKIILQIKSQLNYFILNDVQSGLFNIRFLGTFSLLFCLTLFKFIINAILTSLSPQLELHCGNMRSLQATTIPNTKFGVVHHGNVCKRYDLKRLTGSQCFSKLKLIPLHRISC